MRAFILACQVATTVGITCLVASMAGPAAGVITAMIGASQVVNSYCNRKIPTN